MNIERISVGYGRTFRTGNYESIRLDCTLEATVDETESRAEARVTLQAMAREAVRDEYRAYQQAQATKRAINTPDGGMVMPAPVDPAVREKVRQAENGPGIIREPAAGGAGSAEVKSGAVTDDFEHLGY